MARKAAQSDIYTQLFFRNKSVCDVDTCDMAEEAVQPVDDTYAHIGIRDKTVIHMPEAVSGIVIKTDEHAPFSFAFSDEAQVILSLPFWTRPDRAERVSYTNKFVKCCDISYDDFPSSHEERIRILRDSPDPLKRENMAKMLGWWSSDAELRGCVRYLVEASVKDPVESVRAAASDALDCLRPVGIFTKRSRAHFGQDEVLIFWKVCILDGDTVLMKFIGHRGGDVKFPMNIDSDEVAQVVSAFKKFARWRFDHVYRSSVMQMLSSPVKDMDRLISVFDNMMIDGCMCGFPDDLVDMAPLVAGSLPSVACELFDKFISMPLELHQPNSILSSGNKDILITYSVICMAPDFRRVLRATRFDRVKHRLLSVLAFHAGLCDIGAHGFNMECTPTRDGLRSDAIENLCRNAQDHPSQARLLLMVALLDHSARVRRHARNMLMRDPGSMEVSLRDCIYKVHSSDPSCYGSREYNAMIECLADAVPTILQRIEDIGVLAVQALVAFIHTIDYVQRILGKTMNRASRRKLKLALLEHIDGRDEAMRLIIDHNSICPMLVSALMEKVGYFTEDEVPELNLSAKWFCKVLGKDFVQKNMLPRLPHCDSAVRVAFGADLDSELAVATDEARRRERVEANDAAERRSVTHKSTRCIDDDTPSRPSPVATVARKAARAVPRKEVSRKQRLEHEVHVSELQRALRRCHFERKQEAQHARAAARKREALASLELQATNEMMKQEAARTHFIPPPATIADVIGATLG